jgi:hypothetical protein
MAKQLNIFLENRPGRLAAVLELMEQNAVNLRAITIQDRGDFGILKLLVDMPEKAQVLLSEKGFACALKDVLAVKVDDRPGGLLKLARALQTHGINVLDGYGFVIESHRTAVCCIQVEFPKQNRETLEAAGFEVLEDHELYAL